LAKKVGQKKLAEKNQLKKVSKKGGNKRQQKMWQERWEKSLFLNLSCCCLETGVNPSCFKDNSNFFFDTPAQPYFEAHVARESL